MCPNGHLEFDESGKGRDHVFRYVIPDATPDEIERDRQYSNYIRARTPRLIDDAFKQYSEAQALAAKSKKQLAFASRYKQFKALLAGRDFLTSSEAALVAMLEGRVYKLIDVLAEVRGRLDLPAAWGEMGVFLALDEQDQSLPDQISLARIRGSLSEMVTLLTYLPESEARRKGEMPFFTVSDYLGWTADDFDWGENEEE